MGADCPKLWVWMRSAREGVGKMGAKRVSSLLVLHPPGSGRVDPPGEMEENPCGIWGESKVRRMKEKADSAKSGCEGHMWGPRSSGRTGSKRVPRPQRSCSRTQAHPRVRDEAPQHTCASTFWNRLSGGQPHPCQWGPVCVPALLCMAVLGPCSPGTFWGPNT